MIRLLSITLQQAQFQTILSYAIIWSIFQAIPLEHTYCRHSFTILVNKKADLLNIDCNIVLENSLYRHVFSNCLRGFEFLQPFENLNSGNIVIDDHWLELSDTFSIYLAGQIDNKRIIELNSATASSHEESDRSKINLANIGYRTSEIGANPRLSITAEYEPNSNEGNRRLSN